ncbi:MAG: AAA family ATPase, partial [Lachnospiraceae bacterium]|nr:AAA family ATPase [Lachnospiraceae bacterium]
GEASGGNRESPMLRSKYADPKTPTEAELIFYHRGRQYRIRRNPEYERPKDRGTGFTKEPASAEFYLPDGTVVSKVREVNEAVQSLLGVTREQFSQISMLAQGEFLKLLLADTKERQTIFRDLFQTDCYQILQNRLSEEERKLYGKCQDAKKALSQYIDGISCEQDSPFFSEAVTARLGERTMEDIFKLLDEILSADSKKLTEITAEITKLDGLLSEKNAEIGKTGELYKAWEQKQIKVTEILSEIDSGEGEIEAARKRIETQEIKIKMKTQEIKALKEELSSLLNTGENRAELKAEKERFTEREASLSTLQKDLQRYEKKRKESEAALREYQKSDAAYREEKLRFDHLERTFLDGQAGLLARNLKDGLPCPVCGSREHPFPAELTGEIPSEEELNAAKEKSEAAGDLAAKASRHSGAVNSEAETMKRALIDSAGRLFEDSGTGSSAFDIEELADMLSREQEKLGRQLIENGEQLAALEKKLHRREEIEAAIPKVEETLKKSEEAINNEREVLAAKDGRLSASKKQLAELQEELQSKENKRLKEQLSLLRQEKDTLEADRKRLSDREKTIHTRFLTNEKIREASFLKNKELTELEENYQWVRVLSDTASGRLSGKE